MVSKTSLFVLNNRISINAAAEYSGYSQQYLRRLLRLGKLVGLKIGQVWLIDKTECEAYLEKSSEVADRRFGPKL